MNRSIRAALWAALFLGLIIAAMISIAKAQPREDGSAAGWYISGSFGWNVDGDSQVLFVDEESGLVGLLAVGTPIEGAPGLRAEIEASFRTHDTNIGPVLTAEHDTTALMVNGVYGFQGMGRWEPYLLLGAGVAHTELTFGGLAPLTVENSGFAYQAGVGINYQVSDNVKAGVGYRYFEGPEVELFGAELDGGSNHSLLATVTVGFQ